MYSGVLSTGSSQTNGVELLIEKKRAENFYGLVGATYFNAIDDYDNISHNRDYNYKYIMNVVVVIDPKQNGNFL